MTAREISEESLAADPVFGGLYQDGFDVHFRCRATRVRIRLAHRGRKAAVANPTIWRI